MKYCLIDNEVYAIESNVENVTIIYAPLKRKLFYVKNLDYGTLKDAYDNNYSNDSKLCKNIEILKNAQEQGINENSVGMQGNRAVFLITNRCNLACRYCYAHDEHNVESLGKNQFENVVNFIFEKNDHPKHFTFIGGGEPFADWELLKDCILYIRKMQGIHIAYIGIQTNATLLSKEKIEFLKKYNVRIGCSFDILPDLQNKQRPFAMGEKSSFDVVDEKLKLCIEYGVFPHIRSTISKNDCEKMYEMIENVSVRYPQINTVHLEHVSSEGLTWDNYYREFVNNFFDARRIAFQNGIYLKNSITRAVKSLKTRFCSGEMCITTQGDIVACHRVSGKNDNLFERFCYGKVNESIEIDYKKLDNVNRIFETKRFTKCQICFCKYHCAGQCCNNKNAYSDNDYEELCRFTQEMVRRELEYTMGLN